jgi:hypothetical protein
VPRTKVVREKQKVVRIKIMVIVVLQHRKLSAVYKVKQQQAYS